MRRSLLMTLIVGAMAIAITLDSTATAVPPGKEMSVIDVPDKTKLLKAVLQGKYILIHDDEKMAQGDPCFSVYEYAEDQTGKPEALPDKLVVSFHCQPVQRGKVNQIVLTLGMISSELFELREIQFAGSSEGHRVP